MMKQKSYKHLWTCMCVVLGLCFMLLTSLSVHSVESSLKGTGEKDKPYEISTYAELKEFAEKVNKSGETNACAVLTKDIKCEGDDWTPIGDAGHPYIGTFNGDGRRISNLSNANNPTDYAGLFGYVGSDGTIMLLEITGTISVQKYAGGLVGYNEGTLTQCANQCTINSSNDQSTIGGVAGYNKGTIEKCFNSVNIIGHNDVGGIVGTNENGTIINCQSTGSTKKIIAGKNNVGGIAGNNQGGTITACKNSAKINNNDEENKVIGIIVGDNSGGIAGSNKGTITNCKNYGYINGNIAVGGIVGHNENGTINNCNNTGHVKGEATVGGIGGFNEKGTITQCGNTISAYSDIDICVRGNKMIGGVVGNNNGTISICYNTSVIGNGEIIGGVVGYNSGKIQDCYDTGTCYGDTIYAGIVGHNTGTVTTCYNASFVEGGSGKRSRTVAINEGTVEKCYFDNDTYRLELTKNPEENDINYNDPNHRKVDMIGEDALSKMPGFSADIWMTKESDKNYEYYPHLKGFNLDKDGKQLSAKDITAEDWPPKLNKNDSGTWDQTTDPAQKSTDENNNTDIIDPILNGDTENNKSSSDTSYTEGSHTYTTANGTNYTSDTHTYKTADTVTINGFVELGILMMLALMGLYVSLKKKKI